MMNFVFKNNLTVDEAKAIIDFYNSQGNVFVSQHPKFDILINSNINVRYFILESEGAILGYAKILIKEFSTFKFLRYAEVNGGPLASDKNTIIECVKSIADYCKSIGCMELRLKMANPVSFNTEYIEVYLQRDGYKFSSFYDRYNLSTLQIDLSNDIESIKNDFSSDLKKNLKKAIAKGIKIGEVTTDDEINSVIELYSKMANHRGLNDIDSEKLMEIVMFVKENNSGKIFASYKEDGKMIGGAIIIFEGNRANYYIGFSDPEEKKLPALHSILYEAIVFSKKSGFKYFDMGGYGHYATEKDQIYYINMFKKNFTENFIFYPKVMHYIFKPYYLSFSKALERIHSLLRFSTF